MSIPTVLSTMQGLLGEKMERIESLSLRMTKCLTDNLFRLPASNEPSPLLEELKAIAAQAESQRKALTTIQGRKSLDSFLGKTAKKKETLELLSRMMVNHARGIPENSGVAMHPLYGFPIIPGSALKGIARHHAWAEWQQAVMRGCDEEELKSMAQIIARVFGFPTGDAKPKDNKKTLDRAYLDDFVKNRLNSDDNADHAGNIDFLMAIPDSDDWHLVVDMLNPHGNNDFTEPIPTFFLAVKPGIKFNFYLTAANLQANADTFDQDLEFAARHLREGLRDNGAGAKGAAGYGHFLAGQANQCTNSFTAKMKLETPAFLGGADWNRKDDTNLRIPSLRGLLRWWWRTLYRDFLDEKELQKLENAIWGSTEAGSKIITTCVAQDDIHVKDFDVKDKFNLKAQFANAHNINPDSRCNGLTYLSYGMCEKKVIRKYLEPGAKWTIEFTIRNNQPTIQLAPGKSIEAARLLDQAKMALSLLCQYGGIGSKARKGFGSLSWKEAWTIEQCRNTARKTIDQLFPGHKSQNVPYAWTTALSAPLINISTSDPWNALDRLGMALKSFASKYKHREKKAALGLPRQIHGPKQEPLKHQTWQTHQRPLPLKLKREPGARRLASPIWYHLTNNSEGFSLQIVAFPSDLAIPMNESRIFLQELLDFIKTELAQSPKQSRALRPRKNNFAPATSSPRQSLSGRIKVVMLAEKTKKGGWKARSAELGIGAIQNSADVPPEVKPGEKYEVDIVVGTPGNAQYRWIK